MSTTVRDERTWDEEHIRDCLTTERLNSYLRAAGNDLPHALVLYEWNIRASEALLGLTAIVEVVVRNSIDRELCAWSMKRHGTTTWFNHVPLDAKGWADLKRARARATQYGQISEVHGKVIAELTFGFWRYLLESRYHNALWLPAIQRAFPDGAADIRTRRQQVAANAQQLLFARNRVAHHEPIHARDLKKDLRAASRLVHWVSMQALAWMNDISTLDKVMSTKP